MKIIWRLAPFLCIFLGVVLGGFVLVWAKNIGIFSYVVPPDVPFWLPGKEVGFAASLAAPRPRLPPERAPPR